jgi:homoserine dehydrogenase
MVDQLRVGIAGLGVVGSAAFRLLAGQADALHARTGRRIRVTAGAVRDRGKQRTLDFSALEMFDDPVALAHSSDIDIFVELMGGDEGAARASVEAALAAGKHVVTANKALLAKHGLALAKSRPRSPAASRSSRRCARVSPAIRSSASMAS